MIQLLRMLNRKIDLLSVLALIFIFVTVAWAADTKLSAITNLGAAPASSDELYLNDAGTEKALTIANLMLYLGAAHDTEGELTALFAGKQPLDADLTSVAALTTTAYGRAILELADEAALQALITSPWADADIADAHSHAADAIDAITEIAAALKSGADGTVITGTAGTDTYTAVWNADGDLVDGYNPSVPTPTTIELGHASDTTLSRSAAGELAVEGVDLAKTTGDTYTGTHDFTGATLQISSVTLDDEGYVAIDATADGMADDKYNGNVITGIAAGSGVSQWNPVFLASDGKLDEADADNALFPAIGLAVACDDDTWDCDDTDVLTILTHGVVRNEGWTGLTVGSAVYLSDDPTTTTGIVQTAPSTANDCVQIIGWALSDSEIYFDFSRPYQLVE